MCRHRNLMYSACDLFEDVWSGPAVKWLYALEGRRQVLRRRFNNVRCNTNNHMRRPLLSLSPLCCTGPGLVQAGDWSCRGFAIKPARPFIQPYAFQKYLDMHVHTHRSLDLLHFYNGTWLINSLLQMYRDLTFLSEHIVQAWRVVFLLKYPLRIRKPSALILACRDHKITLWAKALQQIHRQYKRHLPFCWPFKGAFQGIVAHPMLNAPIQKKGHNHNWDWKTHVIRRIRIPPVRTHLPLLMIGHDA